MGTAGGLRRIECFDQRKEWYEGRSMGDAVYIFALSLLSVGGLLVTVGVAFAKSSGTLFHNFAVGRRGACCCSRVHTTLIRRRRQVTGLRCYSSTSSIRRNQRLLVADDKSFLLSTKPGCASYSISRPSEARRRTCRKQIQH